MVTGFIILKLATKINQSSVINSLSLQFTTAHTKSSQSAVSSLFVAW
jgi:hypothetical protein